MAEDKESLSLLGLCFPPSVHPSPHFSLNQIQSVAEAAFKYEIAAIHTSTELLTLCLRDCRLTPPTALRQQATFHLRRDLNRFVQTTAPACVDREGGSLGVASVQFLSWFFQRYEPSESH